MSSFPRIRVHAPDFGAAEAEAVRRCVVEGNASGNSPAVRSFERAFAERVEAQRALAVSSGSTALHLAFETVDLGRGDEIIVPSFTFAPCADMAMITGADVVFVDSDPRTFNLAPAAVAAAITPRTKAVLAVHMYGHPCDMAALTALCKDNDLRLIEDCAQALTARHTGGIVGSFGDLACYSFYANKHVTTGEGGMVTTNDPALADRADWLRSHAIDRGDPRPYHHSRVAYNYRMPAFSAAVGQAQLGRLDQFIETRVAGAARYRQRLGDVAAVSLPPLESYCSHHAAWANGVVLDTASLGVTRDTVADRLYEANIETRPFYYPLHLHDAYDTADLSLPVCEDFGARGLVLPSGNTLTLEQVDRVCDELLAACGL